MVKTTHRAAAGTGLGWPQREGPMSVLRVTDADLADAATRLRAAAAPAAGVGVCLAGTSTGSDIVASAIAETDTLVRRLLDALVAVSDALALDTDGVAAVLAATDADLAAAAG